MPVISPVSGASKQRSLLNIVRMAMGEMGLTQPGSAYGSTDRVVSQMVSLLFGLGEELSSSDWPWQLLTREYNFQQQPATSAYGLPADFNGAATKTFWDRTTRFSMQGPLTGSEWQFLKSWGVIASPRIQFRIWQGQIQVQPVPSSTAADQLYFEYQSTQWIYSTVANGWIDAFDANTNICAFDNRLLVAGLKMRFLQAKKLPCDSEVEAYETALSLAKSRDSTAPILGIAPTPARFLIDELNIPATGYGQ